MPTRTAVLLAAVLAFSITARADEPDARAILEQADAKYHSIPSYSSEGTVTIDIVSGFGTSRRETTFTMKLKAPNLYLITWTGSNPMAPQMTQSGAVWNAGEQAYLYRGEAKTYSKKEGDDRTLRTAAVMSGGATVTIPMLVLDVLTPRQTLLTRLNDPKIEKTEAVDGEECYVISGSLGASDKESYWISRDRLLILKYERSTKPLADRKISETTDEEIEEMIRETDREMTRERKNEMRARLKETLGRARNTEATSTVVEHHTNISTIELQPDDFEFAVPEGTTLTASPFEKVLPGKKAE
jgi:outer membrane lipoprotein-sorting protein